MSEQNQTQQQRQQQAPVQQQQQVAASGQPPVVAKPQKWSGNNGNLDAIRKAGESLKLSGFEKAAVAKVYRDNGIRQVNTLVKDLKFVEVVQNDGLDLDAAYSVIKSYDLRQYLFAAASVSPHVSDATLSKPSEWAKWQRVVMGKDGTEKTVEVQWLDIVSQIATTEGLLMPYRTINWYLSLLTSGVRGHFINIRVIDEDGNLKAAGDAAVLAWINAIGNDNARQRSGDKYKKVVAWIKANKAIVKVHRRYVLNEMNMARWVVET